jgi:hypothetical protein
MFPSILVMHPKQNNYVQVTKGANDWEGNAILVDIPGVISGYLHASIQVERAVKLNIGSTCPDDRITRSGDLAETFFDLITECHITINLIFADGSSLNLASDTEFDNRAILELTNDTVAIITQNNVVQVVEGSSFGSLVIYVSFQEGFIPANGLTGTYTLQLIVFERLELERYYFPGLEEIYYDPLVLKQIHCSSSYQRAQLVSRGYLTNNYSTDLSEFTTFTVSNTEAAFVTLEGGRNLLIAISDGSGVVTASFRGFSKSSDYEVTFAPAAVISVEQRSISIFESVYGGNESVLIDVAFDDGTIYEDALSISWVRISDYINFFTNEPSVISVNSQGILTLLDNWYDSVLLSIATFCTTPLIEMQVEVNHTIIANLLPDPWDVDLGRSGGLQFPHLSSSEFVNVDVFVNAANGPLLSMDIQILFDYGAISIIDCVAGDDWAASVEFAMDEVQGQVYIAGAGGDTSGIIHIATCDFVVAADVSSRVTPIEAYIVELAIRTSPTMDRL